jgi:hypothetical protein
MNWLQFLLHPLKQQERIYGRDVNMNDNPQSKIENQNSKIGYVNGVCLEGCIDLMRYKTGDA